MVLHKTRSSWETVNSNETDRSPGVLMKSTQQIQNVGQSLWLDNITRELLTSGSLRRYIEEYSVTGLTSNPTIFDHAIKNSNSYDAAIRDGFRRGRSAEDVFFDLALDDLIRAAALFLPIHQRTAGVDGWVSIEVSPILANDSSATLAAGRDLHARANCENLFVKIPGTPAGLVAIEEAIFAGIPVNITLLFSTEHYRAAADAYLRGIERRVLAGLNPNVACVASLFISRWDAAVAATVPASLANQLGIAVGCQAYRAYSENLVAPRWLRIFNAGARPQRLLFASTGTKDPRAADTLYVNALALPLTINTMPEATLNAVFDHGVVPSAGPSPVEIAGLLPAFSRCGVDLGTLGATLQKDGAAAFVASWTELLGVISQKSAALGKT
jgi:transaldolase